MVEKKYPIAEIFTSPQGEGLHTGVLMTFIRTAGCSVGKKLTDESRDEWRIKANGFTGMHNVLGLPNPLHVYTEKCTTWDGREFLCDTDFRTKEVLTAEEILDRVPEGVKHICITGGEPLNHDLSALIDLAGARDLHRHIETSGTVPINRNFMGRQIWITVSPKNGCLAQMYAAADELKFLVDENFDPDKIPDIVRLKKLFYIQPINYENDINDENMKRCLDLQKRFPHWRISTQAHKTWRVR